MQDIFVKIDWRMCRIKGNNPSLAAETAAATPPVSPGFRDYAPAENNPGGAGRF